MVWSENQPAKLPGTGLVTTDIYWISIYTSFSLPPSFHLAVWNVQPHMAWLPFPQSHPPFPACFTPSWLILTPGRQLTPIDFPILLQRKGKSTPSALGSIKLTGGIVPRAVSCSPATLLLGGWAGGWWGCGDYTHTFLYRSEGGQGETPIFRTSIRPPRLWSPSAPS